MSSNPGQHPIIFVVAAEPSGDALGGPIIRSIEAKAPGRFRFVGVGGEQMIEAGLETLFPMSDITAFGLTEVLPRIPHILKHLKQVAQAAEAMNPVLVLTIDGPDFSFRLVKKLTALSCPKVHVVAPTVWAWRPKRAKKVAGLYDHLLCLFPFEPPYFEKEGLATSFIGHPLVNGAAANAEPGDFPAEHGLKPEDTVITVLPGSRNSEVDRLLPVFHEALVKLKERIGPFKVLLPTVSSVGDKVKQRVAGWSMPVIVTTSAADKYAAMASSTAALAASGTVSLELALTKLPAVLAYRGHPISAEIFRRMAVTKYVGLPNVILDRELITECLQENCTPKRLADELYAVIENKERREAIMAGYAQIGHDLGLGHLTPADQAADTILGLITSEAATA